MISMSLLILQFWDDMRIFASQHRGDKSVLASPYEKYQKNSFAGMHTLSISFERDIKVCKKARRPATLERDIKVCKKERRPATLAKRQ